MMELISPSFKEGGKLPEKFTCDGDNVSPELSISGVPTYAASLVLIMDDPDVPESVRREKMWDHWVVFNIPPRTSRIPENSQPKGIPGRNTAGDLSYQGPCPPDREHRYFFKLYALNIDLPLRSGATKEEVERAMEGHIMASAQLMCTYNRKPS